MKLRRALPVASLLAAACALADPPAALPGVWESELAHYDIASLKSGEWVEYELAGPEYPAAPAGKKITMKLACVAAGEETAWVEVTRANVSPAYEGKVILLEVRRSDRRVVSASWGKPGAEPAPLAVNAGAPGVAALPGGPPKATGTAKVSREKLKAGAATYDCERVELESTVVTSCCEIRTRTTTWVSEKAPFRPWIEEPPTENGVPVEVQWDGKRAVAGGLVRRTVFRDNVTSSTTLLRCGTDAKPALRRP